VKAAWVFYATHFGTLLKINAAAWGLLAVSGIVLNSVLIQVGFQPNAGPSLVVAASWAVSLYLLCHTVVTTQRYVLLDERPAGNPVRTLFSQRSLRCLGYLAVFIIAAAYGFNRVLGWLVFFMPTMSSMVVVAALLLWAMLGKLVFVFPAAAIDAKTDLMTSLAQTKGNSGRVFFIILLIFVPFVIAHQLALWFDPYILGITSWLLAVLRASIVFSAVVAVSVGLALVYRALVIRPQAETPSEIPPLTRMRPYRELAPSVKWIFWSIVAAGMALPWAVGAGVKLYLDAQGLPTWSWWFFLNPARFVLEITLTLFFASPFIALAFLARYLLSVPLWGTRYWERLAVIVCALVGGVIGTVRTFLWVFVQFNPMNLIAPLPLLYLDDMLRGLVVGCVIAGLGVLIRRVIGRAT
jgi:hypothetical protein